MRGEEAAEKGSLQGLCLQNGAFTDVVPFPDSVFFLLLLRSVVETKE